MRAGIVIIIVILIFFSQGGCSYPRVDYIAIEDFYIGDKRTEDVSADVRMFIRPSEAEELPCMHGLKDKTDREKIYILTEYVSRLDNIKDKEDLWQYPAETINRRGGDCEDKVFLLVSLLSAAGFDNVFAVKGRYLGGGHFWIEYNDMIIDPQKKKNIVIYKNKAVGYNPFFKFDADNIYVNEVLNRGRE